ncbi:MAG TPA: phosphoribosylglycinamide formyltransferase [Thermodesulfobacteriota bacterium]|nr:phosphoribosylglycinamide formyltransferase [Thermodesulfobacteriota bacterium]
MKKMRIAVFVSGSGSNLQAIIDASIPSIEIALVFSNNPDAYALKRAEEHGIPTLVINHRDFKSREEFEGEILKHLEPLGIELIVLAGFMRILSPVLVRAYSNRMINLHPALLPSFPGIHAARQAIEAGVKFTGCTVHFVDEGVDSGPIILQAVVPVEDDDDEDSLLRKIHAEEHRIYPAAIRLISEGKIKIEGKRVLRKI